MMLNDPDSFCCVIQRVNALKSKGVVFTVVCTVCDKTKCESLLQQALILTSHLITVLKTHSKKTVTSRQGNQKCKMRTYVQVLRLY